MTLLYAFVDDSASESGDKRLFLAGFLNTAEQWSRFSDVWDEQLKSGKSIAYLKMSEANSLRKEFRGWTEAERDEKIRRLMQIVHEFRSLSFHASIGRTDEWDRHKAIAPRGLGNAHFNCCFVIVSSLTRYWASLNLPDKIEFIFDGQDGVDDDIDLFFDQMTLSIPRAARKIIGRKPRFEDDKLFAPLQAADMLAWHMRRRHEDHGTWMPGADETSLIGDLHLDCGDVDSLVPGWTKAFERMPGISGTPNKAVWRKLKVSLREALKSGYVPPHGTKLKNIHYALRDRIYSFFNGLRK